MRGAVALGRRTLPRAADVFRHAAGSVRRGGGLSTTGRRRLLVGAVLAALLAATYMFWFRDSSLVSVERVSVTGLTGTEAPRERAALIAAARDMTTLHVDEDALRKALAAGATVEAIHVTTSFPHAIRIEVVEKAPVAVLAYGSERVAVGAGGVLLADVRPIPQSLPTVDVGALPSGQRLGHGRALRLVAAAAAAPSVLRARILRMRELPGKGVVAYIRNGPQVILGGADRLSLKWTVAASILADGTSRGASYVDVRLPDRPVAGGLDVAPPPADDQPDAPPGQPVQPGASTTGTVPTPAPQAAGPASGAAGTAAPPAAGTVPTTGAAPAGTTP
ncbi:MAG: cell division protein FtsQ [Thermoleophilaceae bacterium]|nr:cell division protein FtsQ [Thermoleophilaceae bacterium]